MARAYNALFESWGSDETGNGINAVISRMISKIKAKASAEGAETTGDGSTPLNVLLKDILDINATRGSDVNLTKGSDKCVFRQIIAFRTQIPQLISLSFQLTKDPASDSDLPQPCALHNYTAEDGSRVFAGDELGPTVDPTQVGNGVSRWSKRGGIWYPFTDGDASEDRKVFYCHTERLMRFVEIELNSRVKGIYLADKSKEIANRILRIILGEDRMTRIRTPEYRQVFSSVIKMAEESGRKMAADSGSEQREDYWHGLIMAYAFKNDICAAVATGGT
jgi:hypothetical protein